MLDGASFGRDFLFDAERQRVWTRRAAGGRVISRLCKRRGVVVWNAGGGGGGRLREVDERHVDVAAGWARRVHVYVDVWVYG